jgi:hypothetical protein
VVNVISAAGLAGITYPPGSCWTSLAGELAEPLVQLLSKLTRISPLGEAGDVQIYLLFRPRRLAEDVDRGRDQAVPVPARERVRVLPDRLGKWPLEYETPHVLSPSENGNRRLSGTLRID